MSIKKYDINSWLQTFGVIATVAVIGCQIIGDLHSRKIEATLDFVVSSSNDYRAVDFKYCDRAKGTLNKLSVEKVQYILCEDKESDLEVRNMLAVLEWISVGIREGGLDFDAVIKMRGSYYTTFFERWRPYMQARLDSAPNDERRRRIYDQFEWLVAKISKERNYKFKPLDRTPLSKPIDICMCDKQDNLGD